MTETPSLKTALSLLNKGLWPVPIHAPSDPVSDPGKQPIGYAWGACKPTEDTLRAIWKENPGAGVGLKLGFDGGVIDIEVDDREIGDESLARLLGTEMIDTMGWESRRGCHLLFRWDDRLSSYAVDTGVLKNRGLPGFPGVELRIGAIPGTPRQTQSVVPPSPKTQKNDEGKTVSTGARSWNGCEEIAALPSAFFAQMEKVAASLKAAEEARLQAIGAPITVPICSAGGAGRSKSDRARAYLAKLPLAVEGQAGHDRIYHAASLLAGDFLMTYTEALPVLMEWNQTHARPPESAKQIEHKLSDAMKKAERTGRLANDPSPLTFVGKGMNGENGGYSRDNMDSVHSSKSVSEDQWEVPFFHEPIRATNFPIDVFPAPLARLIVEGAEALQCPPDYFAMPALVLAGAAIGMTVNLSVTSTWIEAPNLFAAVVGPPGTKKSPPLKIMARPLYLIDRELREQYEAARKMFDLQAELFEAAKRKREPGIEPPTEPVRGQLTMDDSTREALAQVHSENLRGLAMVLDELTAWVATLNAYRGGKGDDKQFWLKVNSGSLVKVNRKGDRDPILIPRPCISIVGGLTPAMLPSIADGNDDGWLDRICFSYPEPVKEKRKWREAEISQDAIAAWEMIVRRLWSRQMIVEQGRSRPFYVHLTEGGREAWARWYDAHAEEVSQMGAERKWLAGPWSKLEGFCLRIALILSQLEQANSEQHNFQPWDVDGFAIERAARVVSYLKDHFRRTRGELSRKSPEASEEAESLLQWFSRKDLKSFTEREAHANFRRFDREALGEALRWLEAHNCIARIPSPPRPPSSPGRAPSPSFSVNPKLNLTHRIHTLHGIPPSPSGDLVMPSGEEAGEHCAPSSGFGS